EDAVSVEYRVIRILPALLNQSAISARRVFDKPIAVGVAVFIHPTQRRLNIWPQLLDQPAVTGAIVVCPGEHYEERCGVNRPVITAEGNLSQVRHLAVAQLVQNLAGLRLVGGIQLRRLGFWQKLEYPL